MRATRPDTEETIVAIRGPGTAARPAGTRLPHSPSHDPLFPLRAASTKLRYRRNQMIFNEGDEAHFAYTVISGGVRLAKVRSNGRRQIAEFLLPGDMFGLDGADAHTLSAEALCETIVMRCRRSEVSRLSDDHFELRRQVMLLARRELASMQDHLVILGRHTAKEKLAAFLLLLARRDEAEDGDRLDLPMGRQDIADYLGLTIETVCREMTVMKQEGIIEVPNRHEIVLLDLTELESASEGADL